MKQHLKSIAAPKSWILPRVRGKFTLRPQHSGHPYAAGLPLGLLLRDTLKLAATMAEGRKLLSTREVLVDGRRRQDHRFLVGLFDVLSIPALSKHYRVLLDVKGRITIKEIPAAEAILKPCKIVGKTMLAGGKMQYHLHDGKNITLEQQTGQPGESPAVVGAVGDTLLLTLPTLAVKQVLPVMPGARIFLMGGKYQGSAGILQEIKGKQVKYTATTTSTATTITTITTTTPTVTAGNTIETAKEYVFVVGAAGEKTTPITLYHDTTITLP